MQVVCNKCSSHKVNLICENGKSVRVCRTCFETLSELGHAAAIGDGDDSENSAGSRPESMDSKKYEDMVFKTRGLLEVCFDFKVLMRQLKTFHKDFWVLEVLGLLNESNPGGFQGITLSLFRAL